MTEQITGRLLGRLFDHREDYVLATKVYFPMGPGPNHRGLSRKHVLSAIDASLRRLGTDYVDLYQIHRWDYDHADRGDDGGTARGGQGGQGPLHRREQHVRLAVRQGPARGRTERWTRFVSMQNHYNLMYREEEREMLPLCADQGTRRLDQPYVPHPVFGHS